MPKQQDKVLTALAGEYYVAAELCRRGFMASLTLKNYPKVDVFALDPVSQQQLAIQVKTVRWVKNPQFFVPEDAHAYKGAFVFVVVGHPPHPLYDTFVLSGPQVHDLADMARKDFLVTHPGVKPDQPFMVSAKDLEPYRDNWALLTTGHTPTSPLP